MYDWIKWAGTVVFGAGLVSACEAVPDEATIPNAVSQTNVNFMVVGDLPYNDSQFYARDELISPKLKTAPFVIHLGDFKPGSRSPCTEAVDNEHKAWMASLKRPVFYTPGDNDWSDCDRYQNRPIVRQTQRILDLRVRFFSTPPVEDLHEWLWDNHGALPENQTWKFGNVRFATIHTVAGNNGRLSLKDCKPLAACDSPEEVAEITENRQIANTEWLESVFSTATLEDADAVILSTHADLLDIENVGLACPDFINGECDGFLETRNRIIEHATQFEKPVLLIHGDTSPYCMERSFLGAGPSNLWRLNAAGDYTLIDAVEVSFSKNADQPFAAKGVLSYLLPATEGCEGG